MCMPSLFLHVCQTYMKLVRAPRSIDISLANNMPTTGRQSYEVKFGVLNLVDCPVSTISELTEAYRLDYQ